MKLKIFFDRIKESASNILNKVKSNRKYLVGISLSFLAFLLLLIVIFFSKSDFSVSKEANILVDKISDRKYAQAYDYYNTLQKKFSSSKIDKLNKVASDKISSLILSSGEKYIDGEISKEQFSGLISTVNALDDIGIDVSQLMAQVKRVNEMYIDENIGYEKVNSYMMMLSTLNGVNQSFDEYKSNLKVVQKSREAYKQASTYQQIKKYKEAIEDYNKVVKNDKKYYTLSSNKKQECIELMYDYYLSLAKSDFSDGNYKEALVYIDYLKNFYPNDEELEKLEESLKNKISVYTLSSNDILNLISEKSKVDKKDLSVISYQQIIDDTIYYYAEVIKDSKVINEVLVNAKNKKIYSYKSEIVDYNCEYSDGFYKVDKEGNYIFSITSNQASSTIKNKLKNEDYNSLEMKSKKEILENIDKSTLNKFTQNQKGVYYYALVKKGWFSLQKEIYLVDIYSKKVFKYQDDQFKQI